MRRSAPAATFPPGLDVVCLCRMRRDSLPGHSASPPDCAGRTDPPPRSLRPRDPSTDELFSSTCAQVSGTGGGVPHARPVAVGTASMVTPESSAYGAGPLLICSSAERSELKWCTPGSTARRSGAEADATDRQATGGPGARKRVRWPFPRSSVECRTRSAAGSARRRRGRLRPRGHDVPAREQLRCGAWQLTAPSETGRPLGRPRWGRWSAHLTAPVCSGQGRGHVRPRRTAPVFRGACRRPLSRRRTSAPRPGTRPTSDP